MLQLLLTATGLNSTQLAAVLGLSRTMVDDWIVGRRPVPQSLVARLTSLVGISADRLPTSRGDKADILPAIWYKMRAPELTPVDKEFVLLIRQLGFLMHELEEVLGAPSVGWKAAFETVREQTDLMAPPREQGRQAARIFRTYRELDHGCSGVGEVFRANFRTLGLLIVESPIEGSKLDGCSFYVGVQGQERPCVYANTHSSTWFHRNVVLMHEVAHAIFDAQQGGASLDFASAAAIAPSLEEERAQAFAQEVLVPASVLKHVAQSNGIEWKDMRQEELAMLVAETHVEAQAILMAAREAGLIDASLESKYRRFRIADDVRLLSEHAMTTREWRRSVAPDVLAHLSGKRHTTVSSRKMMLPVPHINGVLEACKRDLISWSRAAELLMVDEDEFAERFGTLLEPSPV